MNINEDLKRQILTQQKMRRQAQDVLAVKERDRKDAEQTVLTHQRELKNLFKLVETDDEHTQELLSKIKNNSISALDHALKILES